MVVEVIDAPWAGVPARIRWHKRRWMCHERTYQPVTFLEHSEKVCVPRMRLGTRAIRWAIRQLRFEGATILGLAPQLGTAWNTVHLMTPPASQGFGYWESMSTCGTTKTDVAGTRVNSHRHRGPDTRERTSHGPLEWSLSQEGLAPCTRAGWPSAEKTSARECESRL